MLFNASTLRGCSWRHRAASNTCGDELSTGNIYPGTAPLTCAHMTPFATPMPLKHGGAEIGVITDYGYETPWATGRVVFAETALADRCARWAEYDSWLFRAAGADELPDDDAEYDATCLREAARRGLTPSDMDLFRSGTWTITTADGDIHDVHSLEFLGDAYVQWRW